MRLICCLGGTGGGGGGGRQTKNREMEEKKGRRRAGEGEAGRQEDGAERAGMGTGVVRAGACTSPTAWDGAGAMLDTARQPRQGPAGSASKAQRNENLLTTPNC